MRVRRLTTAVAVAAMAFTLAACGDDGDDGGNTGGTDTNTSFPAGSTMERLSKAGKMTVGTKFDQPLFGLKGISGKPEGFDVEIAKIIASELGIEEDGITFVETTSKVREEVIEQGKVDLVAATYTINDERKQRVTFAGPYYQAGQDLMVKADNTSVTGPDTLKGAG